MIKNRIPFTIAGAALLALTACAGCGAPGPDTTNSKPATGAGSDATTAGPGAGAGGTKAQKAPLDPSK